MMYDSKLPVCFLDLILSSVLFDAKEFVVVFSLGLFEFEFCIADFFSNAGLRGIGFSNSFEFADSLVPVSGLSEGACFGFTGFEVGRVEGKCTGAVVNCGCVVFQLEEIVSIEIRIEVERAVP